jgi:hypothetical protein
LEKSRLFRCKIPAGIITGLRARVRYGSPAFF